GMFSVQYDVIASDGTLGFLKALDYSKALKSSNSIVQLQQLINEYVYERDIVMRCAAAAMSHVVKGLGYGEVVVPGFEPLDKVNYLIFEHGDGDVRRHLDLAQTFDLTW